MSALALARSRVAGDGRITNRKDARRFNVEVAGPTGSVIALRTDNSTEAAWTAAEYALAATDDETVQVLEDQGFGKPIKVLS